MQVIFLDGADLRAALDPRARRDIRAPEVQIPMRIAVVAEDIDPEARAPRRLAVTLSAVDDPHDLARAPRAHDGPGRRDDVDPLVRPVRASRAEPVDAGASAPGATDRDALGDSLDPRDQRRPPANATTAIASAPLPSLRTKPVFPRRSCTSSH